jgi:hypothetical protein
MNTSSRLAVALLVSVGLVVAVKQGATALRPALPKDMPVGSHFIQSGYDLQRNEPTGDWIACSADAEQNADFCRVTDAHGNVIFQGDFLPVNSSRPVPAENLRFAAEDPRHLWVKGPVEQGPVPVIPLANGQLLVPAADSGPLADRWARDPDELTRLATP